MKLLLIESKTPQPAKENAAQTARLQRLIGAVSERADWTVNRTMEEMLCSWLAADAMGHSDGTGLGSLSSGFDEAFKTSWIMNNLAGR